ncbi:hypothetical protein SSBR45G_27050 [Bradyrhizobium sp. SSBR45G]|uniref:hypothetical protein n=1 Tax=unclassified Bradyrhizobium TaxID=2631580 RepID=UPI002342B6D5|nr:MULTISPECIES: hypothetical protein [unclassified Bradyrhizobium]GLH77797.1 hypothetical protein SSBR45G_27050 [Bradyrhizobium sp. SSBR45G]GLH85582.1 hypothetical protein SSBR45R_30420 [Bradyrhizobium sp. SSBR45R]
MRCATALAILIGTASAALASEGFEIVIPQRPGVPVVINGIDASYAVVEGQTSLGKGNYMQPSLYGGRPVEPEPNVGHYYPTLGAKPGYGRMEIEPPANRKLPKPAESYSRSWGAQSQMQPVQPEVPMSPPNVILAPREDGVPGDYANPPPAYRR